MPQRLPNGPGIVPLTCKNTTSRRSSPLESGITSCKINHLPVFWRTLTTYPADYTLEVLHQKWKAGDIRVPEFQRRFVWKQTQAGKLIESFLVGLPVPAVSPAAAHAAR